MWWWLSFRDKRSFLGACAVEADSDKAALREATKRGLNPGGEVLIIDIPDSRKEDFDKHFPPERRNRLLTREDLQPEELVSAADIEVTRLIEAMSRRTIVRPSDNLILRRMHGT